MEYLNGGDLYSLLRGLGCLDEDMARAYIAELVIYRGLFFVLGLSDSIVQTRKPKTWMISH
jgi:hypothetical protein